METVESLKKLTEGYITLNIKRNNLYKQHLEIIDAEMEDLKSYLLSQFKALDLKTIETELGKVTLVSRQGNMSFNEEMLKDALGVENLDEFKKRAKDSEYIKATIGKDLENAE